jgi:hypothetical protein
MSRRKSKDETWPRITQGNHSTITEYEDGRVEIETNWEVLAQEIDQAIAALGNVPAAESKPKRTRKTRA